MTRATQHCLCTLGAWSLLAASAAAGPGTAFPEAAVPVQGVPVPLASVSAGYGHEHTYIFLINGVDPFHYGGMNDLGKHLEKQGFCHTYFGELYHTHKFFDAICAIHEQDPAARFVLVGFSLGTNKIYDLSQDLQCKGVPIDLMIFLSGNHWLGGMPKERPCNACRVVNILASGALGTLGERDWAENIRLPDAWHFGTPCSASTRELITKVLCGVPCAAPAESGTHCGHCGHAHY